MQDVSKSKEKAGAILKALRRMYGPVGSGRPLDPDRTLIAVILSARSTGKQVSRVLPILLERYPSLRDLAGANPIALERIIAPCGLQRSRAKALKAAAMLIVDKHDGKVPPDRVSLESLPGIGRKSANFILANAFGVPALTVDTHVARVAYRLGLCSDRNPRKVEKELCRLVQPDSWNELHFLFIAHGRNICKSLRPACTACGIDRWCGRFGL